MLAATMFASWIYETIRICDHSVSAAPLGGILELFIQWPGLALSSRYKPIARPLKAVNGKRVLERSSCLDQGTRLPISMKLNLQLRIASENLHLFSSRYI